MEHDPENQTFEEEVAATTFHLKFVLALITGVLVAFSFSLLAVGYFRNAEKADQLTNTVQSLVEGQQRRSYVGGYIQCAFSNLGEWIDDITATLDTTDIPADATDAERRDIVNQRLKDVAIKAAIFKEGNDPASENVCPDLKFLVESGNQTKESN